MPFKAPVEAGAGSVMSSFNIVDGIPATANRWLLTDVLRRQWGFSGMVVTDYASIHEMTSHGLGSLKDNAARAQLAGTDMDMCANGFIGTLRQSLEEGKVTMDDIDRACRHVLEAKYRLGLFRDPYRFGSKAQAAKVTYCEEHRQAARRITAAITLTNTGEREATEVVQLYIHDKVASISRPVKELKDFQRVTLQAGESRDVEFHITADKLKFYNYDLDYVLEPGDFEVMIGPNSRDLKKASFIVE